MSRFEGKVVLITGGAGGQGRVHAALFAGEGADVVVCDSVVDIPSAPYPQPAESDLESVVAIVEAQGRQCLALKADVRSGAEMADVVARSVERFGHIDILLANAGILSLCAVASMPDDVFDTMIDINLGGVFRSIRAVLPHMIERGTGRIIATASIAGRIGAPNIAHYSAAKWGIIGLVKSIAQEVALNGITVNVVAPTGVNTIMTVNDAVKRVFVPDIAEPTDEDFRAALMTTTAQGVPWIEPEDVTKAIMFLASDDARFMTGEVLSVTAGASASNAC